MKKYVFLALFSVPFWCWATSTGGGTPRNVAMDGVVSVVFGTGGNTGDWESDEEFQGFSGIVNWYMTWDDDSLYIGRIGGNNAEGSVLYLRAEYPGAQFTTTGYDYDGLRPGLAPMGGINFAAYLKDSYHEFRQYTGAWSGPATTLSPQFTIQGSDNHMEVALAWNDISNGNGRPDNFRAVLYQVAPPATAGCPGGGPFVYGESPWGTGNVNDGPNIGVNDGDSTSARQPGGCDVGDSTATRWWGCYPVISGVGVNGWNVQQPDAGPDTSICETATAVILQGNAALGSAFGTWNVVSQPSSSPPVSFVNPSDPNTIVQGLTALGDYLFSWDINYGGCPSDPDTVVISRVALPPAANAGMDIDLPCDLDFGTLTGNDPMGLDGQWSLVSGTGTILDPDSNVTALTSLAYGANTFEWSISNDACPASTDQVTVWAFQPVLSLAGSYQSLCNTTLTTLDGIMPSFFGGQPVGTWSQVSGGSTVVFTDVNAFNTTIANLQPGNYALSWTLTNGNCPASTDTVNLTVFEPPIADAGGDRILCLVDDIQLEGNDPAAISDSAYGYWVQASGPSPSDIVNDSLYNTFVESLEAGIYKFAWTVGNGSCPEENDIVTIQLTEVEANGMASITGANPGMSNGAATVATPLAGTPPYQYSLDGLLFQPDSTFDGLAAGLYTATIQDDNGCEATVEFEVKEAVVNPPPGELLPIVVPTGISPNGDGVNDTWTLENISDYPEALVEVYNGWGGLVFRSVGYATEWNGTFQGKDLPPAVYFFLVDPGVEEQPVQKGTITIFR